jgi:tRNA(Ile2) C34 agmatinyltransferase TiaS
MSEPWRWRCPVGHTSWESAAGEGYRCRSCRETFDELHDAREVGR